MHLVLQVNNQSLISSTNVTQHRLTVIVTSAQAGFQNIGYSNFSPIFRSTLTQLNIIIPPSRSYEMTSSDWA